MNAALPVVIELWSPSSGVALILALAAFFYCRGWLRLRRNVPRNSLSLLQLSAFLAGLLLVWVAVGSRLADLDEALLSVHMVQHLTLMVIAPPLILLGNPVPALLQGLPKRAVRFMWGVLFRWHPLEWLAGIFTRPLVCWVAAMGALIGWHLPPMFELGLRSDLWHEAEHACFLATGLLFWIPVIQPWPSAAKWPRGSIPLYLFFATLPCDALSAFLAFCDRVVYSSYLAAPRVFGISPLGDQQCAGALMWACTTFAYLVPAVIITIQILSPSPALLQQQTLGAFAGATWKRPSPPDAEVVS
jgi:cytochrome c oxidase assembly factor CtaG